MATRLILFLTLIYPMVCFAHDHSAWDTLLKKHVVLLDAGKASRVRYSGMAQDRAALKGYLDGLSGVRESEFAAWPRAEQMAFLINAYNAFTVEKILTRYPDIRSIWDFGKVFGNPFRDRFFSLFQKPFSLDEIEHGVLRKRYRDPRIHFAVNCASIGCPMLREEAYGAARLEAQLDEQAMRFLSDASRNRHRDGRSEVSRIFDWYREDFDPLGRFLARYGFPPEAPVSFLDYDWALNDSPSSSRR